MKKAVHFGAGKIGRGFIAELLHNSGYEIVFADVSDALVDMIEEKHQYNLFLIDQDYKKKVIDSVSAYSTIKESEKVIAAILDSDIITTSVMATNLSKIAPLIAEALKLRLKHKKEKVTIMACENAMMGTTILKNAMEDSGILTKEELKEAAVFPNTAVDRMVFDGTHEGEPGVEIGKDFELVIERLKLINPESEPIKGAEYVDDLEMYLQRKIFIINGGHAISGYVGYVNGAETVQDVIQNKKLFEPVKQAMLESAVALEKKYGFTHESLLDYIDKMMIRRFTSPGISDPISRVAREPIRKISPDDRIMGPANLCEKYGLENKWLLRGVACAMHFENEEDQQAVELQNYITKHGIEDAIVKYTGVEKNGRMFCEILEEYKKY